MNLKKKTAKRVLKGLLKYIYDTRSMYLKHEWDCDYDSIERKHIMESEKAILDNILFEYNELVEKERTRV